MELLLDARPQDCSFNTHGLSRLYKTGTNTVSTFSLFLGDQAQRRRIWTWSYARERQKRTQN